MATYFMNSAMWLFENKDYEDSKKINSFQETGEKEEHRGFSGQWNSSADYIAVYICQNP
jgi:hypothetical protein